MKKILSLLTLAVLLFSSCESEEQTTPDADTDTIEFAKSEISIAESYGTLSVTVEFTTNDLSAASVNFEVVDGTAEQGTHYNFISPSSGVLSFTKIGNTADITFGIFNKSSLYSGNLTFTINLTSSNTEGVTIGEKSTCTVTIIDETSEPSTDGDSSLAGGDIDEDIDESHPLYNIVGTYTASGTSYFDDATSYEFTVYGDTASTSGVWFKNLEDMESYFALNLPAWVYGVVSDDLSTITIQLAQAFETYDSDLGTIAMYGYNGVTTFTSSSDYMVAKITNNTITFDTITPASYTDGNGGYWQIFSPSLICTK